MDEDIRTLLIERACARLGARYAALADARDPALADLFAEDGILRTPAGGADGREAVRAMIALLHATRMTRHICSNLVVDVVDEENARGRCDAVLIAERIDKADGRRSFIVAGLGTYEDDYRCEAGQWLIARRAFVLAGG